MKKYRQFIKALFFLLILFSVQMVSAGTWRLDKSGELKAVSESRQDTYLLAVAQVKKFVNEGKTKEVGKALAKLKKDFPEISGPDLDTFIKAETFYSKGKFAKAVRAYDKILTEYPESKLYEAALDRQFAVATAYLDGEKKTVLKVFRIKGYAEGAKIMENIGDRTGNAPIGVEAAVAVARSYEKRKKFEDSYFKWSEISAKWPGGEIGKESLLGMARSKLASYKGPNYNSSSLVSAKTYYENFKERYPKDAEKLDVDTILKQIDEQLGYKQLSIGRYYQRTGSKQSANFYYQMVIDNWPKSKAALTARDLISGKDIQGKKVKK
jgi:outer membrane protein assembly factor BamD (BamD/ComL family)